MLAQERFAYTLVRQSEVDEFANLSGKPRDAFATAPLEDLADRNTRYIICGKGVPEDVLARINKSINTICASPSFCSPR